MDIWWAGPGAKDSALVARLQQALGGDLRLRHATPAQPESLLARALAQRALDGSGLNFKTGKRFPRRVGATRRSLCRHPFLLGYCGPSYRLAECVSPLALYSTTQ